MFGSQFFAWLLLQVVFLSQCSEAARAADAWWAAPHTPVVGTGLQT